MLCEVPLRFHLYIEKVSSLSGFIEVEDVLLEANEKLISDCGGFFLMKKIIDLLLFVFEL
jgi:hypothetical protein